MVKNMRLKRKKLKKKSNTKYPHQELSLLTFGHFFPDNTFFVCIFLRVGTVHSDNFISNIFFQISPTTYFPMLLSDTVDALKTNVILCWIPM